MADQFPGTPTWRIVQARILAGRRRIDECRDLIDRYHLADLESVPKDAFWFTHAFHLGRLIDEIHDAPLAQGFLSSVEPYADEVVHYSIGVLGPMSQSLAFARAAAGDLDGGIADARAALELLTNWKLAPLPIICRIDLAELLARRGTDADIEEARSVVAEALPEVDRMGMIGWRTRGAAPRPARIAAGQW